MCTSETLTRLHLCTVSSEPSLVTYAQYFCVCGQGRFWLDNTCAQSPLSLLWSLMLNMFVYVSREDSDETTLVHSFLWTFSGHLCSIYLCMWAEKILTRLLLYTVSFEPSLVTYAQYVCVCEQGRFWRDYTCAQSPLSLLWSLILNVFVYVGRGDSDKATLVQSLLWAFSGHLCSICLCMWAGKILTRLHLCTVSSEPSLVTYAQYICVCGQGRFWQGYSCTQSPLSLLWSLMLNLFVYVSREDSDETTLVHSLLWAFSGHLCSIYLCMWAGEILTRLLLYTVSFEPSLVTYAQYVCVCEQGRLWRDNTCALSPLSLPWSHMLNILCMCTRETLTRLNVCIVSSEPSLVTGPRSAVGNVSGCRCLSDCRSRGREFDPGPVPYFRGDWSWNNFYGHSPPFRWFIQEGLLSVTSESMCTNYWLTACSSLPRKKCG